MGLYLVVIVDDKGSTFLDSPPVTHLSLSSSESLRLVHLLDVGPGLDVTLKEDHGFLGLGEALDLVCHDQGNLRDVLDAVT